MTTTTRLLLLSLLGMIGVLGQGPSLKFVSEGRPDVRIDYESGDKPTPRWENGYFLAYDPQPENAPIVYAFGSSGANLFRTPLSFDGAAKLIPHGIAASPDGTIAVSGSAYSASGVATSFIAYLDKTGKLNRVVRLERFGALRLCFTDRGRLWAAGLEPNDPSSGEPPDHDIIRIYDDQGKLERSLLRKSLFTVGASRHPASAGFLAANKLAVVFFSSVTGHLVEMSTSGEVLSIQKAPLPSPRTLVTGLAISESSRIVMSCQFPDPMDHQRQTIAFYLWDKEMSHWTPIDKGSGSAAEGYGSVFGVAGESVLIRSFQPVRIFSWLRIQG